jgi:hypothetical protein
MTACRPRASRQTLEKQSSFIKSPLALVPAPPKCAQTPDNTGEKQARGAFGTRVAIKTLTLSGASDSALRWGGRRNSAARTSSSLSLNQAAQIIEAAQFAAAIGLPFNRMLTIHWGQAGIADCRAAWATGRFLKLASDWIAKRCGRFSKVGRNRQRIAWAWVRENGDGKGSHVHILMHLPADKITGENGKRAGDKTPAKQRAKLGNMPRRWLRSITGAPYIAGTIKTERIGGTAGAAQASPAAYRDNLAAVVGYVLKGASPAAARALGLERIEAGGVIIGKRAATSQNVGRSARSRLPK